MGKYMKKNKMGSTVVDISLGVRTRARTLALEQLKKQQQQQQQSMNVLNFCYLELRSRKLEKVFFKATAAAAAPAPRPPSSSQLKKQQTRAVRSEASIEAFVSISRSSTYLAAKPDSEQANKPTVDAPSVVLPEARSAELEASCGDNVFDQDANSSRDSFGTEHFRRVREETPARSSSMTNYQLVEAPGSSSRPQVHSLVQSSSQHTRTGSGTAAAATTLTWTTPSSPTQEEIEDFFAELEDAEAKGERDRYNYDFLNDVPLPGRFEWTIEPAATTGDQHQQCIDQV